MKKIVAILLCVAFLLVGCGEGDKKKDDKRLSIVTTEFYQYDFARTIVEDDADVTLLVPAGTDIHSFEPTAADIAKIQQCDIFFYTGGESDSWVEQITENIDTEKTKVVRLADYIYGSENMEDEHYYTSPEYAVTLLGAMSSEIGYYNRSNYRLFFARQEAYADKIKEISDKLMRVIEKSDNKTIVVADRFPFYHMTELYRLEYVAAFDSCDHDTDADVATVTRLIGTVKEKKIPVVYHIENSNKQLANTVAEATGAEVAELHSYQIITAEEFEEGVTYLDLLERNYDALLKNFQ